MICDAVNVSDMAELDCQAGTSGRENVVAGSATTAEIMMPASASSDAAILAAMGIVELAMCRIRRWRTERKEAKMRSE